MYQKGLHSEEISLLVSKALLRGDICPEDGQESANSE
jgi:hypothetical protein